MRCRIYTDGSYDNENNIGGWSNIIVNKDKIKVKSGIKIIEKKKSNIKKIDIIIPRN